MNEVTGSYHDSFASVPKTARLNHREWMQNGSVSLVSISYNSFAFTTRNTKQDATQY